MPQEPIDQRETIVIDTLDREVLYLWRRHEKEEDVDFEVGSCSPNGTVRGVAYDKLIALGRGSHDFPLVQGEAQKSNPGDDSSSMDPAKDALKKMILGFLGFEVGLYTGGELESLVLMAFAPGYEDTVLSYLTDDYVDFLRKLAVQIPETREGLDSALKNKQTDWIGTYTSNSGIHRIPTENLWAIKERFG